MKKLNKLKLNQISKNNLSHKQMRHVMGGSGYTICQCSCYYEGQPGAPSVDSNCMANMEYGYVSNQGSIKQICVGLDPITVYGY